MSERTIKLELTADEAFLLWCWWSQFDSESTHDEPDSDALRDKILCECAKQGLIIRSDCYRWLTSG